MSAWQWLVFLTGTPDPPHSTKLLTQIRHDRSLPIHTTCTTHHHTHFTTQFLRSSNSCKANKLERHPGWFAPNLVPTCTHDCNDSAEATFSSVIPVASAKYMYTSSQSNICLGEPYSGMVALRVVASFSSGCADGLTKSCLSSAISLVVRSKTTHGNSMISFSAFLSMSSPDVTCGSSVDVKLLKQETRKGADDHPRQEKLCVCEQKCMHASFPPFHLFFFHCRKRHNCMNIPESW
jgi:hypothetical protein